MPSSSLQSNFLMHGLLHRSSYEFEPYHKVGVVRLSPPSQTYDQLNLIFLEYGKCTRYLPGINNIDRVMININSDSFISCIGT